MCYKMQKNLFNFFRNLPFVPFELIPPSPGSPLRPGRPGPPAIPLEPISGIKVANKYFGNLLQSLTSQEMEVISTESEGIT